MSAFRKKPLANSSFLDRQSRVVAAIARGAEAAEAAEALVSLVEGELAPVAASVLELATAAGTLSALAVGDLPPEYAATLQDVPIGPYGTCARAAFDGQVVIHRDTEEEPDWAEFRELVERYDFRAAWSLPLYDTPGRLCGTLGLYFPQHREPSERERGILERCAHLGGLIIGQKRMQAQSERGKYRMVALVDRIAEGVFVVDTDGVVTFASEPARSMLEQATEPVGDSLASVLGLTQAQAASLARPEPIGLRMQGRWLRVQLSSSDAEGQVYVVRDETETRRASAELMQADRLASLGTLAAGLAHEIASPLMALSVNLDALAEELPLADADHRLMLEDARSAAGDVEAIVDDMRTYVTGQPSDDEDAEASFEDALAYTLRMVGCGPGEKVRLIRKVVEGLPPVAIQPVRLGQVLTNLILNAVQAVGEDGHVWIEAERVGDEMRIDVRDDGPGMAADVAELVKEPFFTTKGADGGMGLGLAIVDSIVEQAAGRCEFETGKGQGTTVTLWLPLRL